MAETRVRLTRSTERSQVRNRLFFHSFKPASGRTVVSSEYRFTESRTKYLKRVHQGESVSEIGIFPIPARADAMLDLCDSMSRKPVAAANADVMPQHERVQYFTVRMQVRGSAFAS